MKKNDSKKAGEGLTEDQKRLLPVIIIPLVVIVLMIIIVIADHSGKNNETEPEMTVEETSAAETMATSSEESSEEETEAETETETETEPETDPADAFVTDTFKRDSDPEILKLMKRYFQARAGADAETMNQIYGRTDVAAADVEAQKTRLLSNSKYVEGFENVTTYVMNGTTSDAWLVFTVTDIKFFSVKTKAPMIMWCYVTKDAEGNYHIAEDATFPENVRKFIDAANHSETVRKLASDVNNRLKTALDEDADLNAVYGVLRDGSPVYDSGETPVDVVIGDETTAAEEGTSAEGSDGAVDVAVPADAAVETDAAAVETDTAETVAESAAETTAAQ